MTDCTSVMGARARAATWNTHPPMATRIPSTHQRLRKSAAVEETGWRHSTGGAFTAPRCL